jgi:hypothetical protein
VGFAVIFFKRDSTGQNALVRELGKGLLQLVEIGVLGTVLKLLADAHQAKRLRAEQRAKFWRNKYRRLVEATNKLRRVPLVLPADPVPATLQQHMLTVLDVASELRVIKHEIHVAVGLPDSPIAGIEQVTKLRLITAVTLGERLPDVGEDTDEKTIGAPSALTSAMSSAPRS